MKLNEEQIEALLCDANSKLGQVIDLINDTFDPEAVQIIMLVPVGRTKGVVCNLFSNKDNSNDGIIPIDVIKRELGQYEE